MIPNSFYLFLAMLFLGHVAKTQENLPQISFVSNSLNKAHPFYDIFSKKDTNYINWLYFHCKGLQNRNTLKLPENKPLMFRSKNDAYVVEEVIPNCVHPKLYEDERETEWQSEVPLYGSFPLDINFHLANDPENAATIDLFLQGESSHVKMFVLTEEGDPVDTIIDKSLQQGSHKFYWVTTGIKAGNYLLFTEIDKQLTIHSLAVERNWFSNLFSRNREVYRTKRFTSTSFESLPIQTLKVNNRFIHRNRFGTSLGIHLPMAAMITIKILSIQGDYISTLIAKKVKAGESLFLLDKHIEKTGWYLVQLSINDTIEHLKLKIKK